MIALRKQNRRRRSCIKGGERAGELRIENVERRSFDEKSRHAVEGGDKKRRAFFLRHLRVEGGHDRADKADTTSVRAIGNYVAVRRKGVWSTETPARQTSRVAGGSVHVRGGQAQTCGQIERVAIDAVSHVDQRPSHVLRRFARNGRNGKVVRRALFVM